MPIVDLQIRIARKLAAGRGAMQLSQDDLNMLVQCGAYGALCNAATEELKQRGTPVRRDIRDPGPDMQPVRQGGRELPEDVETALARARAALKQPLKPRK